MKVLPSNCDCEKCSKMCHAPCCGTPEDIQKLIDNGYANRLMLDDLPGGPDLIKPALKGFEEKKSPWEVKSEEGCTFWNKGKCELHDINLKPLQGKLANHANEYKEEQYIANIIQDSWETKQASEVINVWKNRVGAFCE